MRKKLRDIQSEPDHGNKPINKVGVKDISSDIFSLLEREDEKYITEKAYDNPVFVEDIVRNASERRMKVKGVLWFSVESENIESIHNHSAYAQIEMSLDRDRR